MEICHKLVHSNFNDLLALVLGKFSVLLVFILYLIFDSCVSSVIFFLISCYFGLLTIFFFCLFVCLVGYRFGKQNSSHWQILIELRCNWQGKVGRVWWKDILGELGISFERRLAGRDKAEQKCLVTVEWRSPFTLPGVLATVKIQMHARGVPKGGGLLKGGRGGKQTNTADVRRTDDAGTLVCTRFKPLVIRWLPHYLSRSLDPCGRQPIRWPCMTLAHLAAPPTHLTTHRPFEQGSWCQWKCKLFHSPYLDGILCLQLDYVATK